MSTYILEIYDSIQEIAWYFGSHGINGECCGDISFIEYRALRKTYEKKQLSVQEIGNALNFTKSGASRIIDRLQDKGYAKREHSPVDGRVCCIAITTKGKELIVEIERKYTAYLEKILKDLDPKKIEQIKDSLQVMVKSVQQQEDVC